MTLAALALLDEVQHLQQLQSFDPARFLDETAAEIDADRDEALASLGARLDALREALDAVDRFTVKAMNILLLHILADAPVPPQLRTLVATTITSYAGEPARLRQRLLASLRLPEAQAQALVDAVMTAAERLLGLRAALRAGLFELTRRTAARDLPWVQRAARDRSLPDPERRQLRLARVDLEQLQGRPEGVAAAPFEQRLRAHPLPEEEPEVEQRGPDRFSLIEID